MIDGGLRQIFRIRLPQAQWTPVESGFTIRGIPDCEYCFDGGRQGWIEFKATGSNGVKVRPEQVAWAERRGRLGGRVFVAVRIRREPGEDLLRIYGADGFRPLLEGGLRAAEKFSICQWIKGPARWGWERMELILAGPRSPADKPENQGP